MALADDVAGSQPKADGAGAGAIPGVPGAAQGAGAAANMNTISAAAGIADQKAAQDRLREFYKSFMSESEYSSFERGQMSISDLIRAAEKVSFRAMNSEDFSKMTPEQQRRFKESLDRKMRVYDFIQNYTGLSLYNFENGRKMKKAQKLYDKLEAELSMYEKELSGRTAVKLDNTSFYDQVLRQLPMQVKNDPKLQDLMEYMGKNSGYSAGNKGLVGVRNELSKRIRAQSNLDDLLQAQIGEYDSKLGELSAEIAELGKRQAAEPQNQQVIQERMEKDSLFSTYMDEKLRLEGVQEKVLDAMMDANSDYKLADREINMKEAVKDRTKEVLTDLKYGIKALERSSKGKNSVVVVGNTLMMLSEAQKIAYPMPMVDYVGTEAIGKVIETVGEMANNPIRDMGGSTAAQFNLRSKEHKRQYAEMIKRDIATRMYAV